MEEESEEKEKKSPSNEKSITEKESHDSSSKNEPNKEVENVSSENNESKQSIKESSHDENSSESEERSKSVKEEVRHRRITRRRSNLKNLHEKDFFDYKMGRRAKREMFRKKKTSELENKNIVNPKLLIFKKKVNVNDLIKQKYNRIRNLWNSKIVILQKSIPGCKRLHNFLFFESEYDKFPLASRHRRMRLELNRLDFILQKLIVKGYDVRNLFSVFDEFLTYRIILMNNEKKTGVVAQLLGDYYGRSINTIRGQTQRIARVMNKASHDFVYNQLVLRSWQELSQEIKLAPSFIDRINLKNKQTRVLRFSFIIDLFLLNIYRDLGLGEYIDNIEVVNEVFTVLKNNRKISIAQTRKWRNVEYSEVSFERQNRQMVQEPSKFNDFVLEFEDLIISSGFLEELETDILTDSSKVSKSNSLKEEHLSDSGSKPGDDKPSEKESEEQLSIESQKNLQKSEKKSSCSLSKKSSQISINSLSRKDPKNKSNNSSNKSMSIKIESLNKRSNLEFSSSDSSSEHWSQADQNLKKKISNLKISHLALLDWGLSQIKTRFNFERIEVEEWTSLEKQTLLDVISLLSKNPYYFSKAEYLTAICCWQSKSMSEFLRNLDIFLDLMSNIPELCIASREKLVMVHLSYKVQKIAEFVRLHFFDGEKTKRNESSSWSSYLFR